MLLNYTYIILYKLKSVNLFIDAKTDKFRASTLTGRAVKFCKGQLRCGDDRSKWSTIKAFRHRFTK